MAHFIISSLLTASYRVGNVIKMWIDKHFHDFANDSELTVKVTTFVEQQILHDMEAIGKSILKLFKNSVRRSICAINKLLTFLL